jgi:hypothetical protein
MSCFFELTNSRNTRYKNAENFYNICLQGNIVLVERRLADKHRWWSELNAGLEGACVGGHLDIVKLLIKHGAEEFHQALRFACIGGHLKIVRYLLLENEEHVNWDCNIGLSYVCERGYRDILDILVTCGANDFNNGLYYACKGGQKEIAELMVYYGATATCNATMGACSSNRPEMIHWLIQKTVELDWNMIFENACVYNWIDLLLYTILNYYSQIKNPEFILNTTHYDIYNSIQESKPDINKRIHMRLKLYDKNIFNDNSIF